MTLGSNKIDYSATFEIGTQGRSGVCSSHSGLAAAYAETLLTTPEFLEWEAAI
jgi:hypothetical protein